ncbi:MAG: hypothetical protein O2856_13615, partial [Planctomycetota bacterium]|nr:hypothetical protein [Planctomycetota bacterium]
MEGARGGQTRPAQAYVNGIAAALGLPSGRALSSTCGVIAVILQDGLLFALGNDFVLLLELR